MKGTVTRTGKAGLAKRREKETDLFSSFQREMQKLFDDFFGEPEHFGMPPGHMVDDWSVDSLDAYAPNIDVSESDDSVTVSAELPGMDEKDIHVEITDDLLTIRGERNEEKEEKNKNWVQREQHYGAFHRTLVLPAEIATDKAKAKFRKGVLTVTAPKLKQKETQKKAIKIETT